MRLVNYDTVVETLPITVKIQVKLNNKFEPTSNNDKKSHGSEFLSLD